MLEAIQNMALRNLPAAIDSYTRMIEIAPDADRPHVYLDLGRAYEKNEEPDKAIESYLNALKYDPQLATAHLRLGIIYGERQKDLNRADESFNRAEDLYRDNREGLAELFFNRGRIYNGLNRLAEARDQLKRVTDYGNDHQKIRAILELSSTSLSAGNFEQALREASEGLSLAQKNKMTSVTTQGYLSLAQLHQSNGGYEIAKDYYHQAIDSASAYGGQRDIALARVNLGSILIHQGHLDDGLREVEVAQRFFEASDYRNEQLWSLGIIIREKRKRGEYEAARSALERMLPLAEKSGDRSLVALVYSETYHLLIYQERHTEAIPHNEVAYAIYESLGLKPKIGYALAARAVVTWELGDYQSARKALKQATAIAVQPAGVEEQLLAQLCLIESRLALSEQNYKLAILKSQQAAGGQVAEVDITALNTLGMAEALSGSVRAGLQHCQEAVTRAESIKDERLIADAALALAQVKAMTGQWQDALALAKQAQELFSRHGRAESEWRAWLTVARSYSTSKMTALARESALKAEEKMNQLQQRWGAEAYARYLTRPDIKSQYARLRELLSQ